MIKLKKQSKNILSAALLLSAVCGQFLFAGPLSGGKAYADPAPLQNAAQAQTASSQDNCDNTIGSNGKVSQTKVNKCLNQSPIVKDIQNIVNFLSAGVGIIVIAMIIVGGIQYSIAGDNSSATTAAKTRITNAMIALFAFLFAWAFLQWLIPGGIFG